jgi:hypothetical protein
MTDVIYVLITLAAFVGLALLVGVLDRRKSTEPMSEVLPALGQIGALVLLLALTVPLLGRYLAHIYTSDKHLAAERVAYRVMRVDPDADQHWRSCAMSVLGFSLVGILVLFGFGRLQQHLPLSLGFPALPTEGAWNTRRQLRDQHELAVVLRRGRGRSPHGARPRPARHGRHRGDLRAARLDLGADRRTLGAPARRGQGRGARPRALHPSRPRPRSWPATWSSTWPARRSGATVPRCG